MKKRKITTIDGNSVESLAGLKTLPQLPITDVKIRDYDLVLISVGYQKSSLLIMVNIHCS